MSPYASACGAPDRSWCWQSTRCGPTNEITCYSAVVVFEPGFLSIEAIDHVFNSPELFDVL